MDNAKYLKSYSESIVKELVLSGDLEKAKKAENLFWDKKLQTGITKKVEDFCGQDYPKLEVIQLVLDVVFYTADEYLFDNKTSAFNYNNEAIVDKNYYNQRDFVPILLHTMISKDYAQFKDVYSYYQEKNNLIKPENKTK